MNIAVYPGSFDPVTLGHLDIIKRACKIFDKVVVAVFTNANKTPAFSVEQRKELLRKVTKDINNVKIASCDGLLIDYAREIGASTIVRGLRAVTDFEYELQMAQTNSKICDEVETIFMATGLEYAYLSSSIVKEVAHFNGDIRGFIPEDIIKEVESVLKGASL